MNNDLISRKETERLLRAYADEVGCNREEYELANGILKAVCFLTDNENVPTAYDLENVIERLEDEHINCYTTGDYKYNNAIDKALEIVQSSITTTNGSGGQATHECIREFAVEKYDDNGFPTGKGMVVKEGSKWEVNKKSNIAGGEIHLDNVKGTEWVEISEEILNGYFKETVATNDEDGG